MSAIDLNAVAVKAVYDSMSDEQRGTLVKEIFTKMLSDKEGNYGQQKTLLERVLVTSVNDAVRMYANEYFKEHEAELKDIAGQVLARIMGGEGRDILVEEVSKALQKGMRETRY